MKKMMIKKMGAIICVIILLVTIGACARNGDTDPAPPADDPVVTDEGVADDVAGGNEDAGGDEDAGGNEDDDGDIDEPAPGEVVDISFYTWWGGGERAIAEEIFADFRDAHPHINLLENFVTGGDYLSVLNTRIAAGSTPDVFQLNEYLILDWGAQGVGKNLLPLYLSQGIDPFEFFLETALYLEGDNLWGVDPHLVCLVLYYNPYMFAEAGIDPPSQDAANPWTWDQFVEAAIVLTSDMNGLNPTDPGFNYDNVVEWGVIMPGSWIFVLPLLYSSQTSIADDTGTELLITQPTAVNMLQEIANLAHVHQVAPTLALTGLGVLGDVPTLLMNNQLGMFIGGSFQHGNFINEGFEVGIAQIPSITGVGGNMAWAAGFMMAADTPHPEAALEVFHWNVNYENMVNASLRSGVSMMGLPQIYSVFEDPQINADWVSASHPLMATVAGDILVNGSRLGENVTLRNFGPMMNEHLVPMFDEIWLGRPAAEGMAEIEPALLELLDGAW